MSKNEIIAKIEALTEWENVIEEAKAEAEAIRDSIKAEMLALDTEEMTAGKYIVRWTSVLSNRFDTTAFKKPMENSTRNTRSKAPAADFQSAHKEKPLARTPTKAQRKELYPNHSGKGKDIITCPLREIKNKEQEA